MPLNTRSGACRAEGELVKSPPVRSCACLLALVFLAAPCALSAGPACPPDKNLPAGDLLRRVINGELKAQADDHSHWMYEVQSNQSGKHELKLVVQTAAGDLDRLEAVGGQPVTAQERKREDHRIEDLLRHPGEQKQRQHDQQEDAQRTDRLMKMLPDAVTASYGKCEGELTELLFTPNPAFHPSSHEASVFHSMAGHIWVNSGENRIAEIDGHLVKEVKFFGGLLGHLEKGGTFHVKQAEVAPGHWDITLLHVNMHGRALFFKTISVQQDETRSNFCLVPDNLTLAQAAEKLEKQKVEPTVGHVQKGLFQPDSIACFHRNHLSRVALNCNVVKPPEVVGGRAISRSRLPKRFE